jgi:hypothetical protein
MEIGLAASVSCQRGHGFLFMLCQQASLHRANEQVESVAMLASIRARDALHDSQ